MTTWTLPQVAQVERLRARLSLDMEIVEKGGPEVAQRVAAEKMAAQLIHMAHPFAVEPHPDDFEVIWTRPGDRPWDVVGEMRWHPRTNAVELKGGHCDGQRIAVRKVGEPVRIPRSAATPFWGVGESTASAALVEMSDTYELVGWREAERVWLYEAR